MDPYGQLRTPKDTYDTLPECLSPHPLRTFLGGRGVFQKFVQREEGGKLSSFWRFWGCKGGRAKLENLKEGGDNFLNEFKVLIDSKQIQTIEHFFLWKGGGI